VVALLLRLQVERTADSLRDERPGGHLRDPVELPLGPGGASGETVWERRETKAVCPRAGSLLGILKWRRDFSPE